jgi:hypothetical protein
LTRTTCNGYGYKLRLPVYLFMHDLNAMSIRLVARDLYRLIREVSELEKQIENAAPEIKAALKNELRKVKAESERVRRLLDGSKERSAKG